MSNGRWESGLNISRPPINSLLQFDLEEALCCVETIKRNLEGIANRAFIINRKLYKKTGSVFPGVFVNVMFFTIAAIRAYTYYVL